MSLVNDSFNSNIVSSINSNPQEKRKRERSNKTKSKKKIMNELQIDKKSTNIQDEDIAQSYDSEPLSSIGIEISGSESLGMDTNLGNESVERVINRSYDNVSTMKRSKKNIKQLQSTSRSLPRSILIPKSSEIPKDVLLTPNSFIENSSFESGTPIRRLGAYSPGNSSEHLIRSSSNNSLVTNVLNDSDIEKNVNRKRKGKLMPDTSDTRDNEPNSPYQTSKSISNEPFMSSVEDRKNYGSISNSRPKSYTDNINNDLNTIQNSSLSKNSNTSKFSNFIRSRFDDSEDIALLSGIRSKFNSPFDEQETIAIPYNYSSTFGNSTRNSLSKLGSVVNNNNSSVPDFYQLSQLEQKKRLKKYLYLCFYIISQILLITSLIILTTIAIPMLFFRDPHFQVESIYISKMPTDESLQLDYNIKLSMYNPNMISPNFSPESLNLRLSLLDVKSNIIHPFPKILGDINLRTSTNFINTFNQNNDSIYGAKIFLIPESDSITIINIEGTVLVPEKLLHYFTNSINSLGWILEGEIDYKRFFITQGFTLNYIQRLYNNESPQFLFDYELK